MLDNVQRWLRDFHIDGLRLDAVHELHDESALHVLEEMAREVDELAAATGRTLWLVAESDRNDPRTVTPRGDGLAVGGQGLDGQWADDIHHALHVALTGETQGYYGDFAGPEALTKVLGTPFFHDGTYSSFRGRRHGRPVDPATVPGWRFVASLQTHDQVGNRALGDRLSGAQLDLDPGVLACGAAMLLTSPYTPMLFMGEEWGARTPWQFFTDHTNPEIARLTAEGRRGEFGVARVGRGRRTGPAGPGHLHAARSSTGRSPRRLRTTGCCSGTATCSPFAAPSPTCATHGWAPPRCPGWTGGSRCAEAGTWCSSTCRTSRGTSTPRARWCSAGRPTSSSRTGGCRCRSAARWSFAADSCRRSLAGSALMEPVAERYRRLSRPDDRADRRDPGGRVVEPHALRGVDRA